VGDVGALETSVIAIQNNIFALTLSGTQVNYTNNNSVIKTIQPPLCELDDHISFLNDHVGDVGVLENTVNSITYGYVH
jgi:hypothetical protein